MDCLDADWGRLVSDVSSPELLQALVLFFSRTTMAERLAAHVAANRLAGRVSQCHGRGEASARQHAVATSSSAKSNRGRCGSAAAAVKNAAGSDSNKKGKRDLSHTLVCPCGNLTAPHTHTHTHTSHGCCGAKECVFVFPPVCRISLKGSCCLVKLVNNL